MTFRDKPTPVHRVIPNAPGRKVIQLVSTESLLMYYCVPCGKKYTESQPYGACPYCETSLIARVKE